MAVSTTPRWPVRLLLLGGVVLTLLGLASAASAATFAPAEERLAAEMNRERADRGLPPLVVDVQLTDVARRWSGELARRDRLEHNPAYGDQITGGWRRAAENVGYASGGSVDDLVGRMHRAFMDSPGHRDHILGTYDEVGVGVTITDGKLWVAVNFAAGRALSPAGLLEEATGVSRSEFGPDSASAVVLARSDVFADALGGAALAGASAPVLFTTGPRPHDPDPLLHPVARAELDRVLPAGGRVYLLGGPGAISDRVARELAGDGYDVRRLAGASRVETALRIAEEVVARHGRPEEVLLARSDTWPDAITGGAYAAHTGAPLLLTAGDRLDPAVAAFFDRHDPDVRIALGGTAALSDGVVRAAHAERVAGRDRAATAVAVVERLWGRQSAAGGHQYIATPGWADDGWASALAHAPVSARHAAPQLLVGTDVPGPVADYLGRLDYGPQASGVLRPTRTVPAPVADRLRSLLGT